VQLNLLDDLPEEDPEALRPGLAAFAQRLAELIPNLSRSSSLLITGEWGAGKTTLLKAVARMLETGDKGKAANTVWFDAWRYEGENALLPILLRRVWDARPNKDKTADKTKALFDTVWRCALAVSMRAAPSLLGAFGVPVLPSLIKDTVARNVGGDLKELPRFFDAAPPKDPTDKLVKAFSALVKDCWGEAEPVIFIDDLDRCSPDGAVALMDGLRMILAQNDRLPCRFVVALDRGVMAKAVGNKFTGVDNYDGNRYLEKVFPLGFHIPRLDPTDAARLTSLMLDRSGTADSAHRDVLSRTLTQPVFANPRIMKRCINRYRLVTVFEDGKTGADEVSNRALAQWIAATERWHPLRRMLAVQPKSFWEETRRVVEISDFESNNRDVAELLSQQDIRGWLTPQLFSDLDRRLDELSRAEERLRRWGL